MSPTLKVSEILEVALYVTDLVAAENFYTKILGLPLYSEVAKRHVFLRCGDRLVLLFDAEATMNSGDGPLDAPEHGVKAPKPKGLGLCFVDRSVSEEMSYAVSTEGPQAVSLKMFIAALMSRSW